VDALDRIIDVALQANISLIGVKQNEDMRKISAWVGIAAVPTMVAGIYGMNFENMPELSTGWGYYAVLGLMGAAAFGLHRLFRRNKWL
jgi:magnesium transporter